MTGGKTLNTSPPGKFSDGSSMESRWSSRKDFPLCRNLRCRNLFNKICSTRPVRRRLCDQRSSQGQTHRSIQTTVKRQTTYEDLRMIKSVVRPQDFMLSLDVESVFFHVPTHPKNRKFFSSHLALPLFVNKKFMELSQKATLSAPDQTSRH